ncbi:hypothetical protein ACLB2K_031888 [Fragaria x ananassa]
MHIKTMLLPKVETVISILLLSLTLAVLAQEDVISLVVLQKINGNSSTSPFLKKIVQWPRPREPGCRNRPWTCHRPRDFPRRWQCCRNQCVEVSSDVNNCGLCGNRCPFGWQCCRGFCVNTNISIFNCGRCGNRCPFGVRCTFGMCGYAQPQPRPRPCPPKQPRPQPPQMD